MKDVIVSGSIRYAIYVLLTTVYFWYSGNFESEAYSWLTIVLIYLGIGLIAYSGAFFRTARHQQEKGKNQ